MFRWGILIIGSLANVAFSWRWLRQTNHHGFYRFFAFEGLLALLVANLPAWFRNPFSPLQIVSWLLLLSSIPLAAHGFHLLQRAGRPETNLADAGLLGMEKTTRLVTGGVYRYIRHPLYASLMALGWGIFLKQPDLLALVLGVFISATLFFAARTEEEENLERFGEEYRAYMQHTRLFIPFVF